MVEKGQVCLEGNDEAEAGLGRGGTGLGLVRSWAGAGWPRITLVICML